MRHIAANTLTILIAALLGLAIALLWGRDQIDAPGPLAQNICLTVPPGGSIRGVSERLSAQEAIPSGFLFRTAANMEGADKALKAGAFIIPQGASVRDILGIITGTGRSNCGTELVYRIGVNALKVQIREMDPESGKFAQTASFDPAGEVPAQFANLLDDENLRIRVAVAEGVTSWQITESLKDAAFLSGELTMQPPEGMLAPDSYEIRRGEDRTKLVERMMSRQQAILDQAWERRVEGLPLKDKDDALILASIIEKETGVAAERRLVASVFINRLNQGMLLQTDPTVIYGLTNGQGVLGRGLFRSELRRKTPYNTYVIKGLPPGPIANPGRAAIEAALNPESSGYLFFVADGTGGHAFASTLKEHNDNVRVWRKIEAEQRRTSE